MGVPKFYRWISERFPCLSEVVREHQIPEFDNFYLDMNGIIHTCSHPDDGNPHFRITDDEICRNIMHYLEVLFQIIKPRKVFFMAIDGVAPRAKMNQQRGRRFRSAKEAEVLIAAAVSKGELLPDTPRFDSNCITPGTRFMAYLHEKLKTFVVDKLNTDPLWRGVHVYLSGHETPGEGEHKIMDFIRCEKTNPHYDFNTRHCLYGLDADLLMLGLTTHAPHFALLREEVKFGKQNKRASTVEETIFHLLHISLLREYLKLEFECVRSNLVEFEFDLERIIDDWVLMGFLVGNDFIPHLPNLHIAENALPSIWNTYKRTLPLLGGYLTEKGVINLNRLEIFLHELSEFDFDQFTKLASSLDIDFDELVKQDQQNLSGQAEFFGIEAGETAPYKPAKINEDSALQYRFKQHKSEYYQTKLELPANPKVLKGLAEDYIRGLQWTLLYYYQGVPSWSWYYPHHYAPYLSDLINFADMEPNFQLGTPFLPFQQLMAVLPEASMELVPPAYWHLMSSSRSPISEYYPKDFFTDLNGKKMDWEAVVLIPFIDERRLLSALKEAESENGLADEEKKRNKHGPCLIYSWTREPQGQRTVKYPPYQIDNHAKIELKTWQNFCVSVEEIIMQHDTTHQKFCTGFPTFQHIPHSSHLSKMSVQVFQQASRNDNRIIQIHDDMDIDNIDLEGLADKYLDKIVWIRWPHLIEARVTCVETDERRVELQGETRVAVESDQQRERRFISHTESVTETYMKTRGIDVGPTFVLIHARPFIECKYQLSDDNNYTVQKIFSKTSQPFAIQAIVTNDKLHEAGIMISDMERDLNLEEMYSPGTTVFTFSHPHYGYQAEVRGFANNLVEVAIAQPDEPNLDSMKNFGSERYMRGFEVAQRLGVSGHLVSRITGCIFMMKGTGKDKIDVGLNLKSNKKSELCPGYTLKEGDDWLYSRDTEELINQYAQTAPEFFNYLQENLSKDKLYLEAVFPENATEKLKVIKDFLKSTPPNEITRASCGSVFLSRRTIDQIFKTVQETQKSCQKTKRVKRRVKPGLLYRPSFGSKITAPDTRADYRLFDRVVNVKSNNLVPFGLRGTVVGIIPETDHKPQAIEVLFDEKFDRPFTSDENKSGLALCFRCSPTALVNISHGEREAREKGFRPNPNQKPVSVQQKPKQNAWNNQRNSPNHRHSPNQTKKKADILKSDSPVKILARSAQSDEPMSSPNKHQASTSRKPPKPKPKNTTSKSESPHFITPRELGITDARQHKSDRRQGQDKAPNAAPPVTNHLPLHDTESTNQHADVWEKLKMIKSAAEENPQINSDVDMARALATVPALQRLVSTEPQTDSSTAFNSDSNITVIENSDLLSQPFVANEPKPGDKLNVQTLFDSAKKEKEQKSTRPKERSQTKPKQLVFENSNMNQSADNGFDFSTLVKALEAQAAPQKRSETTQSSDIQKTDAPLQQQPVQLGNTRSHIQGGPARSYVLDLLQWTRVTGNTPPIYQHYNVQVEGRNLVCSQLTIPSLNEKFEGCPMSEQSQASESAAFFALDYINSSTTMMSTGLSPVIRPGVQIQGVHQKQLPLHTQAVAGLKPQTPKKNKSAFVPTQVMKKNAASSNPTTPQKPKQPVQLTSIQPEPDRPNIVGEENNASGDQANILAMVKTPTREQKANNSDKPRKPRHRKSRLAANFNATPPQ